MTQEVLKLAEIIEHFDSNDESLPLELLKEISATLRALAQTELCKYGQEPKSCTSNPMDCQCAIDASLAQTQEPVACKTLCELCVKRGYFFCANAVKTTPITAPPQRTERPVDCERCNRLEEHAYDLIAKLRVANIKLSMQSQRTWVGLTRDEQSFVYSNLHNATSREDSFWVDFANAIEAKLKELNT
jgi:hypothetical protein